jgi:hypothetical protein
VRIVTFTLDILDVSEVRWLEFGERRLIKRRSFLYSDRDEDEDHGNGAGILISKKANNSLIE